MKSRERNAIELLAPAGDMDAAYAAFHYGADAIYLGLKRFSARAEAANFSADELSEVVGFAHAASPRRSVYVAMNTLIQDRELDEVIEALALVAEIGADALIVQDLGVLRLARRHFPTLALHASTQMGIHSLDGAIVARELGFSRVTLARELTLAEVGEIVREAGIEVEVFIHGALCYSYSGMCLYSSLLRGRSGNRGQCTYPCRDRFTVQEGAGASSYPFSMKDLALGGEVSVLREAGVKSFKIEGRKKSALYVATTTDYYRQLLDGHLQPGERESAEEAIKTVFSRPWTNLYVRTRRNRDVIDAEVVGHRGVAIGTAETAIRAGAQGWLRFKTRRRLERHDGLQIDIPGEGRPFGFAVDHLRRAGAMDRAGATFEAPANAHVEVRLPPEHPSIPKGAQIYCSSSQEIKQRYRFARPKPGVYRVRWPANVTVRLGADRLTARASVKGSTGSIEVAVEQQGTFGQARNAAQMEAQARQAFERTGDTPFDLGTFAWVNPEARFAAVSLLNAVRRELLTRLAESLHAARLRRIEEVRRQERGQIAADAGAGLHWSIKTDRVANLDAFEDADWPIVEELIIDIDLDPLPDLMARLQAYAGRIGAERVRLALPMVVRAWERSDLGAKIRALREAGWTRWEAANLAAWRLLREHGVGVDGGGDALAADWPIYITNRSAVRQALEMGVSRFVLAPDDGPDNIKALLAGCASRAVVLAHQDTPLFISGNCATASLAGRCPAHHGCRTAEKTVVSADGEGVRVIQKGCRTVVVADPTPGRRSLARELAGAGAVRFRADFINRQYSAAEVRTIWRTLTAGLGR